MSSNDEINRMVVSYFWGHGNTNPAEEITKQALANCDLVLNSPDQSKIMLVQFKHSIGQGKTLASAESAMENLTQDTFEQLWSSFRHYEVSPAYTDLTDNAFEATCNYSPVVVLDELHQVEAATVL